jgi:Mycoplasma protein of unknown function, DUF285
MKTVAHFLIVLIRLVEIVGLSLPAASVMESESDHAVEEEAQPQPQPGADIFQTVRREPAGTGTTRQLKGTMKGRMKGSMKGSMKSSMKGRMKGVLKSTPTSCNRTCFANNTFTSKVDLQIAIANYPSNQVWFGPINDWCFPEVTDLTELFSDTPEFNEDISCWDVSGVNDMDAMFFGACDFNQDIAKWDVSRVNSMMSMFFGASAFRQNLCAWGPKMKMSGIQDVNAMFFASGCASQQSPDLNANPVAPLCSSTCPA